MKKPLKEVTQAAAPGPWTEDPEGLTAVSIEGADGSLVCDVHGGSNNQRGAANRALILHWVNNGPKLLAALKDVLDWPGLHEHVGEHSIRHVKDVLKEAEEVEV
jgi:hypothetical protein